MLLWAVVLLLDASGSGTPPAPPGCLFVPSGSDRLITSDGDVFRVVCAGGGGADVLLRHRRKVKAVMARRFG